MSHPVRNAVVIVILMASACSDGAQWRGDRQAPPGSASLTASMPPPVSAAAPLTGPDTAIVAIARHGAAIVAAHPEPVLTQARPHVEAALQPADALRAATATESVAPLMAPASVAELGRVAVSLYRFCHHWPEPDDLTDLVARGLVRPGQATSDACASFE